MLVAPLLLLACDPETMTDPPTITFLSPSEGDQVEVGDVPVSVVVENFTMTEPKHSDLEGLAAGYAAISLDGGDPTNIGSTTFTVAIDAAGEHTLDAELLYEDGDALEVSATATVTFTAVDP